MNYFFKLIVGVDYKDTNTDLSTATTRLYNAIDSVEALINVSSFVTAIEVSGLYSVTYSELSDFRIDNETNRFPKIKQMVADLLVRVVRVS